MPPTGLCYKLVHVQGVVIDQGRCYAAQRYFHGVQPVRQHSPKMTTLFFHC